MIVQFSIYPTDSVHIAKDLQRVVHKLRDRGFEPEVGPIGTCIQGDWPTVMSAIQDCHRLFADAHERVVTNITIDDHRVSEHSLRGAVRAMDGRAEAAPPPERRHVGRAEILDDAFADGEQ